MQKPTKFVDTALGFDSKGGHLIVTQPRGNTGLVYPGEVMHVIARPQLPFRCNRLSIPAGIADQVLIHSLRIGNHSQFASGTPVVATPFATQFDMLPVVTAALESGGLVKIDISKKAKELVGQEFRLPTCQISQDLSFTIENLGVEPLRFLAVMIGISPLH